MSRKISLTHRNTKLIKSTMISFDLEPLEGPLSPAYSTIAPPSSLCHPGSSTMTDGDFEAWGLLTENQANHGIVKESAKEGRSCTCFLHGDLYEY